MQQLVAALLPAVTISHPINALAFEWDGVLFVAGGSRCESLGLGRWEWDGVDVLIWQMVPAMGVFLAGWGVVGTSCSARMLSCCSWLLRYCLPLSLVNRSMRWRSCGTVRCLVLEGCGEGGVCGLLLYIRGVGGAGGEMKESDSVWLVMRASG